MIVTIVANQPEGPVTLSWEGDANLSGGSIVIELAEFPKLRQAFGERARLLEFAQSLRACGALARRDGRGDLDPEALVAAFLGE